MRWGRGGVLQGCRAACLLRRHATVTGTHRDKVMRLLDLVASLFSSLRATLLCRRVPHGVRGLGAWHQAKHRPQFVRGVVRSLQGVRSLVCTLLFRGCTPTSAASQKVWVL